jgi:predicted PurR-regulated permease PerM
VLHLARDVLIPLALAILAAFLLAPAVRQLERLRLGRVVSTLLVVALGFALLGAVGAIAASQAISVAAKLPEYRENVRAKIRSLRHSPEGKLSKAADAIKDLESEAAPAQAPIAVTETPASPLAGLAEWTEPVAKPAGITLAVLVFTILMLLHRENMRERLVSVIGAARISVTTQAMAEAAQRVSRFLLMQLVINAGFGIPFAIALYFIGIPNAMLWGLLATLLRFIPYAGVWIAIAMPALLAIAIDDGWTMLAWTLGVFAVLEAIAIYVAEPILYGRSAGLSAMAVILAAIFWTWLWGPIGLLLAMPLTVCVTVIGRHVPQLAYFNTLLGVEPVLAPEARFYQRLVALDQEEATELAEKYAEEKGAQALLADVVIPALSLAERDRHHGELDARRERFLFDTVGGIVEELEFKNDDVNEGACVVPAHDEADLVAAQILARASGARLAANVDEALCPLVCISAVPPHAASHAASLARRIRRRQPETRILVALWASGGDASRAIERLRQAGADQVLTRLPEAIEALKA